MGHENEKAVLVTGCSGFIGRNLVQQLSKNGNTVVAMYHRHLPEPMANVYPVCSDMSSNELIAAPLRGIDTVIHLAWGNSLTSSSEKAGWTLHDPELPPNIDILINLIKAMEKAKTKRLIFVSAIGANRNSNVQFLQEKYLAEFFILNSNIPEKIIIRSSVVYGGGSKYDRFLRSIMNLMQYPLIYPVPRAKEYISPIHISDLVSILTSAINIKLESSGSVLEVCGKEKYKLEEIFKLVLDKYVKSTKLPLKGFLGEIILPLCERNAGKDAQANLLKLKNFLSIGSSVDESYYIDNSLAQVIPSEFKNLHAALLEE